MTINRKKSTLVRTLWRTARPPFLLLVVSSISLVLGCAWYLQQLVEWGFVAGSALAAVLAHCAVNMLNEHHDCKSGLDFSTRTTPFSGGSHALVESPHYAPAVGAAGYVLLGIAVLLSVAMLTMRADLWLPLLILGLLGVLVVVTYSPYLTRNTWLCLLAPGLAFGPVIVVGSYMMITGTVSVMVVWLSLIPALLSNNLLLINQYPDIRSDKQHGRRHMLTEAGPVPASHWYAVQGLLVAWVWFLYVVMSPLSPVNLWLLLALLPLGLVWYQARTFTTVNRAFLAAMAINVAVTLLFPVMIMVALCVGA